MSSDAYCVRSPEVNTSRSAERWLMLGYDWYADELDGIRRERKKIKEYIDKWRVAVSRRRYQAAKAIAAETSVEKMKRKLIRLCHVDDLEYAMRRYAQHEDLPSEHVELCRRNNCLEILVKGILGKVAGIPITNGLAEEIGAVCQDIRVNANLDITYARVGLIQEFIHRKVQALVEENAHLTLPRKHMKNLLSAARLHLNIYDIKARDYNYLQSIRVASKTAVRLEEAYAGSKQPPYPRNVYWDGSSMQKQFDIKWRVRHMRPIEHYFKRRSRRAIEKIDALKPSINLARSRQRLTELYAKALQVRGPDWTID